MTVFVAPEVFAAYQQEGKKQKTKTRMPTNRKKSSRAAQLQPQPAQSDYDTDTANYTDNNQQQSLPLVPPPKRSNAELNYLVLKRWYPNLDRILAIAPFSVVYTFSPETQIWEKSETQGSLFVCQLGPSSRSAQPQYKVIILNRRNPKNFDVDVLSEDNIEITTEYVIVQSVDDETGSPQVFGIWIFAEGEDGKQVKDNVVQTILDCARNAQAQEDFHNSQSGGGDHEYGHDGVEEVRHATQEARATPTVTGQSIDINTLFGKPQQPSYGQAPAQATFQNSTPSFAPTADTDFFRGNHNPAAQAQQQSNARQASQQNALLDLFKNANKG